jgi:hypothetical protein
MKKRHPHPAALHRSRGVMPEGFEFPQRPLFNNQPAELWVPIALFEHHDPLRTTDDATARRLHARGIPLSAIHDALVLGALRKYRSWLEGGAIATLRYFEPIVEEVVNKPLPAGYDQHLRDKLKNFGRSGSMAHTWHRFSSNPRTGGNKLGAVWLRKKVTTNRGEKQRRDDIDVNFLSGGPKESSEVAERSCRNHRGA